MAIEMSEFDNFDPHEGKFINTGNSEDAFKVSGVSESRNDKKFTLDEALNITDEAKSKGTLKDGDIVRNYIYNAVTDCLIPLDNLLGVSDTQKIENSEIYDNDIDEVDFADSVEDEVIEFENSDSQSGNESNDSSFSAKSEISFKVGKSGNHCICTLGRTSEYDIIDISTRKCPLVNRGTCKRYSQLMSIYKTV